MASPQAGSWPCFPFEQFHSACRVQYAMNIRHTLCIRGCNAILSVVLSESGVMEAFSALTIWPLGQRSAE